MQKTKREKEVDKREVFVKVGLQRHTRNVVRETLCSRDNGNSDRTNLRVDSRPKCPSTHWKELKRPGVV